MTWLEAKLQAKRIMGELLANHSPEDVRLILRALSRLHHKPMKTTEKQTKFIQDLAVKSCEHYVSGPVTPKTAEWLKIREMVKREALKRATTNEEASKIIAALQMGVKSFGLYLGDPAWKALVTAARDNLCVLDMKIVVVKGQQVMTTVVVDKSAADPSNPAPHGPATVL